MGKPPWEQKPLGAEAYTAWRRNAIKTMGKDAMANLDRLARLFGRSIVTIMQLADKDDGFWLILDMRRPNPNAGWLMQWTRNESTGDERLVVLGQVWEPERDATVRLMQMSAYMRIRRVVDQAARKQLNVGVIPSKDLTPRQPHIYKKHANGRRIVEIPEREDVEWWVIRNPDVLL